MVLRVRWIGQTSLSEVKYNFTDFFCYPFSTHHIYTSREKQQARRVQQLTVTKTIIRMYCTMQTTPRWRRVNNCVSFHAASTYWIVNYALFPIQPISGSTCSIRENGGSIYTTAHSLNCWIFYQGCWRFAQLFFSLSYTGTTAPTLDIHNNKSLSSDHHLCTLSLYTTAIHNKLPNSKTSSRGDSRSMAYCTSRTNLQERWSCSCW